MLTKELEELKSEKFELQVAYSEKLHDLDTEGMDDLEVIEKEEEIYKDLGLLDLDIKISNKEKEIIEAVKLRIINNSDLDLGFDIDNISHYKIRRKVLAIAKIMEV